MKTDISIKQKEDRAGYMREYMKQRYNQDKEKHNLEQTQYRYGKKYGIDTTIDEKYKEQAVNIIKFRKTISELKTEPELLKMLLEEAKLPEN